MNSTMPALNASARIANGKSVARRLRSAGQIPGVAYGKSFPSTPIAVSPKEVLGILKSVQGQNSVIKLALAGEGAAKAKDILVMIREYTYHPVKRSLEHVDFVEVKLDQPVDVAIPLIATGKAAGIVMGGIVRQVYRTLPVRCLPDRIPVKLEIDITHLKLNEHVSTKDLTLIEGVTVRLPPDQTLVAVVAPEKDRSEDVAPTGAAPGAAAAAAPAAGKAAAAAPAKDAKAAAAPAAKDAKKK
jgi:large subunit ribosomal protein L25